VFDSIVPQPVAAVSEAVTRRSEAPEQMSMDVQRSPAGSRPDNHANTQSTGPSTTSCPQIGGTSPMDCNSPATSVCSSVTCLPVINNHPTAAQQAAQQQDKQMAQLAKQKSSTDVKLPPLTRKESVERRSTAPAGGLKEVAAQIQPRITTSAPMSN